ncbi:hypothetical protein AB0E21_28885 [Streptomyces sp. NPDC047967]|uniref:hypothetical protein n=1 Tax=Streptomyces TaxID=1883 RepID=UPI00085162CF|nr:MULTISPECIES: hypothetical protein [unclassified Streptomyces]
MSKALLCVGDGAPVPRHLSDVVMVVAVLIVLVGTLGSASVWQDAAQALVAETVAAVVAAMVVAVVKPSAYERL